MLKKNVASFSSQFLVNMIKCNKKDIQMKASNFINQWVGKTVKLYNESYNHDEWKSDDNEQSGEPQLTKEEVDSVETIVKVDEIEKDSDDVENSEEKQEQVDEGVLSSIKDWFGDTQHFWNNLSKDQRLWTRVVEQIKESGKKGLQAFSKIMVDAAKNNKDDLPIVIKDSTGKLFAAENPIITSFKGMKLLCVSIGESEKGGKSQLNSASLEGVMDQEKIKKLGELSGITVVEDKEEQDGNNENTSRNSFVVIGASIEGDKIILALDNKGNMENQRNNLSKAEKFAM